METKELFVIGHKNPDTDSVAAAIAYANLKEKNGVKATPLITDEVNKGTALALKKFGVEKPKLAHMVDFPEAGVILVDHNEAGQWADGLIKEHVHELIDHHRFGDFSSAKPIFVRVEPVGSTSTIIAELFQEYGHVPERHIAGMMLSAILTDTLMFNSPTTTEVDRAMAEWLNEIVEIDMMEHAQAIFKAKSDISDMAVSAVISKDFKEFHFNSKIRVGIGMFETVDAKNPLKRTAEFIKEISQIKNERKLDYLLFIIVDILKQEAYFVIGGDKEQELVEHVFCGEMKDHTITCPGVVSRKKQIVPPLEEHFAGLQ
jgi:manganese-dependent inorganic pyrophosphatase